MKTKRPPLYIDATVRVDGFTGRTWRILTLDHERNEATMTDLSATPRRDLTTAQERIHLAH